jgi:hypothetical protein
LRVARELRENLQIPNRLTGTSNADWVRELRRLRMRGRRGQTERAQQRQQQIQPVLREIPQQIESRQQRIERIQQERLNRFITNNNFQSVLNMAFNENVRLTMRQATTVWNNLQGSGRYSIHVVGEGIDRYIAVNATTKDFIVGILIDGGFAIGRYAPNWGSDVSDNVRIDRITSMTLQRINPQRAINNRDGRFFPYINTSELDLTRYQIYNQEQAYRSSNRLHCLIHTLQQQGIKQSILNSIKLSYISGVNIRKKDLHDISKMINRDIYVYTKNGGRIAIQKIKGKKPTAETTTDIHIAIYANHYFTYEETEYSKYSINNYDELKDEEDFHNIIKKKIITNANGIQKTHIRKEANKSKINSLLMIDKFYEQGKFKKLDMTKFEETSSHIDIRDHIYLDNIENEQQLCEDKKQKEEKKDIYYADCESFVSNNSNHELYLLGCVSDKNDCIDIYNVMDDKFNSGRREGLTDPTGTPRTQSVRRGDNEEVLLETGIPSEQLVINEWLKNMTNGGKNDALCYFHNLKYDYHLLESYLNIRGRCEKDGQLYNVICIYKGKTIELRDSYKLLPFALSKFGSEFDLPKEIRKKEAIAYEYYTRENNNESIPISEYSDLLSNDEKIIFNEVVKNEPSFNICNKTFNPLEYYKEYLRLDCLVLKKGLQKFNDLIMEITRSPVRGENMGLQKMSVYDSLTISSLTDKYMKLEGSYEGIWEVQGNLRAYIAEAVYGGRVCVNKKYQKKVIEGKISDYDGVSLYPSAIHRLCDRMGGLPKGMAKRFNQNDLSGLNNLYWENKTYSIMSVKITKVNKTQQMPFIAQKEETSIRYINTPPKNPDGSLKPIIIDSITLSDYIKFHEIEYELLDGVYWNY